MAGTEPVASTSRFLNEPSQRWTQATFDELLRWAHSNKASDIKVLSRNPIWAKFNGAWMQCSRRCIDSDEVFFLLQSITRGPTARAQVTSGHDHDFSYEVRLSDDPDDLKRLRFRGNVTACRDGWSMGAEITLRLNPDRPPSLDDIQMPAEIVEAAAPENGLILFSGVMGSGKTTSQAALLAHFNQIYPWSIATYEQPIEYDIAGLPGAKGPVAQTEVPLHFRGRGDRKVENMDPVSLGFGDAPRNAARRAEDAILVGESRDRETLSSMIEVAEIGSRVYSTLHTRSVAAAPLRIINVFPPEQQNQITASLINALRLIVQQRLVKNREGTGRVALREYLSFDAGMRDRLMAVPITELTRAVEQLVQRHGRPLLTEARTKHAEGLIGDATLHSIEREYQDREKERLASGDDNHVV